MNCLDERRTARLSLTRVCVDDLEDLGCLHSNPQVMATLGGIRSAEESRCFLNRTLRHWEEHGFGLWVVRDLATRRFAGRGGLRHVILAERKEIEVGYTLMPEFWGRGLATELARESVQVGLGQLHRPDLISFALPTNAASRRVMQKVGFRYEGEVSFAKEQHVLYRLTRAAWEECCGSRRL